MVGAKHIAAGREQRCEQAQRARICRSAAPAGDAAARGEGIRMVGTEHTLLVENTA